VSDTTGVAKRMNAGAIKSLRLITLVIMIKMGVDSKKIFAKRGKNNNAIRF